MTSKKKIHDIVFVVEGTQNLVKGVTKHTTCSDVISTIFKGQENEHSFAVFESSRGIDRILPGRTKVLKVIRTWGSDKDAMEFVIRRTDSMASAPKVSHAKRRLLKIKTGQSAAVKPTQQSTSSRHSSHVTHKIQNVEMLAELVKNQKRKLASLTDLNMNYSRSKSNEYVKDIYFKDNNDSFDNFMCKVDADNMAGFLKFCGTVTANEIERLQGISSRPATATASPNVMVNSKDAVVKKSNSNIRFAVKKSLKSSTTGSRRETLSTERQQTPKKSKCSRSLNPNFTDGNFLTFPVCSTPIPGEARQTALKRNRDIADNVDAKINRMNSKDGKKALLKRYFKDYNTYSSPSKRSAIRTSLRQRGDGVDNTETLCNYRSADGSEDVTSPQLRSLAEKCKSYWTSADDSEDELTGLDVAFITDSKERDGCTDSPKPSTSRQTSASSLSKRLVDYDATVADRDVTRIVDYSISDDESSAYANNSECSQEIDSLQDENDLLNQNIIESDSDEGLSSLGSGDITEDRGIFV